MRKAYAGDEIRELIEAREKAERDELDRLHHARKLGLEEGRELGLEEGREQGREEAAKAMLELGAERDFILKVTGLWPEELDRL